MLNDKLVIAISSRALFDLDNSNDIFEKQGLAVYTKYQIENENMTLLPGVAFSLIKRLLDLRYPDSEENAVEIILVSRNDANTGLRVFNSIEKLGLSISRAAFTNGRHPYQYLKAFEADLFLSASSEDVRLALDNGCASATILTGVNFQDDNTKEVRIAFDGDAVLFSDEAEIVYREQGLEAFKQHEAEQADIPLSPGPFKMFLESLYKIQKAYQGKSEKPIRTALVTARSAPSHKRAIKTLRAWGIQIDEAFFLGGLDKTAILEGFRPHIFFDDQQNYCINAAGVIPTGHVPAGINNKTAG